MADFEFGQNQLAQHELDPFGLAESAVKAVFEASQPSIAAQAVCQDDGCLTCPHLGLCLNNQPLINTNLLRKAGASDLDWLDELVD